MRNTKKIIEVILHVLFWVFVQYRFLYYSVLRPLCEHNLYKEFLSVAFLILIVYLNYFILIPRLFNKNKPFLFWLLALSSIVVSASGELVVIFPDIKARMFMAFETVSEFNKYIWNMFFTIILRNGSFVLFVFLLKLYQIKDHAYRLEKQVLELEEQRHRIEIEYQTSKIAPAYLLNTLSSLELMALEKNEELPLLVNKLSQVMDYYLGSSNKERVLFEEEVQFYNNYIDLELLRLSKPVLMSSIFQDIPNSLEIPPLLFEPLISKAMKYAKKDGDGFVKIEFRYMPSGVLQFICLNNRMQNSLYDKKEDGETVLRLRSRLELLYGDNFTLEKEINEDLYEMKLSIRLG